LTNVNATKGPPHLELLLPSSRLPGFQNVAPRFRFSQFFKSAKLAARHHKNGGKMLKIIPVIVASGLGAGFSVSALASPKCTSEPQNKWLTEAAMKEKIAALGYKDIRIFKKIGSCYEIYGRTAGGKKAEVYFNPVDGSVVDKIIK
jgi:hypothetical protein